MTFYTQSSNGAAVPCNPYSTEEERMESETWRNIERQAAYELRQSGQEQSIFFMVK